jgi:hypothetical protein
MVDRRSRSEFTPFYFDLVINYEANRSIYDDATCILGYFLTARAAAPGTAGRKAVIADWRRSGWSACASPFAGGAVNRSTISVVACLA